MNVEELHQSDMEKKVSRTLTKEQAARMLLDIIYEAIRDSGDQGIPSGHLYAMLMGHISFETYSMVIDALTITKKISNSGHLLKVNKENPL